MRCSYHQLFNEILFEISTGTPHTKVIKIINKQNRLFRYSLLFSKLFQESSFSNICCKYHNNVIALPIVDDKQSTILLFHCYIVTDGFLSKKHA